MSETMGFKRERSNNSDSATDDSSRRSPTSGLNQTRSAQRSESSVPTFRDQAHAEAHYGQKIESATELHQLQRLEKRYGDRLHGWLAEGMPKRAMGDPHEMAEFRIQRAIEGTGTTREEIPETVLEVVGDEGQPLPETIQRSLEDRMDADFSDVRIQRGPKAAEACDATGARAFTCGNKIAFNTGEYDTRSPEGQHLLAHELAHVKQQTGGAAISIMPQEGELQIDPDPQLEREADEAAAQALAGEEPLVVNRMGTEMHIQRHEDQVRLDNGEFGPLKKEVAEQRTKREEKPYGHDRRPSYAPGQRKAVWERAKDEDGLVFCAVNDVVLDRDNWCMGHKPRREYRYLVEYYLRGIISREEFLREYRNPDHYQPESHHASSSGEHEENGQHWIGKWGPLE